MRPANERFTIPEHEQGEAAALDDEGVLHTGNSCLTERVAITVGEQP
ncbi:hypothetical protein [Halapricum salinum]|nr:hypothetical protein [Halapricum salinum]